MNTGSVAATAAMVLTATLAPTSAHAVAGSSASLRVNLGPGCTSKVKGPGMSRKVSASTTFKGLRPGTYTVRSNCGPKKRVKLKRGQRKKVTVRAPRTTLVNPRQVPLTISGTFEGSNVASPRGTQDTTWQGTVTLERTREISSDSINFPYATHYKVTAISGTVRPMPLDPNPTLCYDQNGTRSFGIGDVYPDDSGDSFPGATLDPWEWAGHGRIYNVFVQGSTDGWTEVGTQTCPVDGGMAAPDVQPYSLRIPSELLLTDGWSGIPSNSQPTESNGHFKGSYSYAAPGTTISWSWDLRGSDYVTVDGPTSVPGGLLTPLVP